MHGYMSLLVANFVCPAFVARQVYNGSIVALSQKMTAADNVGD